MTFAELVVMKCKALKGPEHALERARIDALLGQLRDWKLGPDAGDLRKDFKFRNFSEALGFVNALGWIAEQENHHPDLELGWGRCQVRFSTHDVGGISLNDFICAAKTEALINR